MLGVTILDLSLDIALYTIVFKSPISWLLSRTRQIIGFYRYQKLISRALQMLKCFPLDSAFQARQAARERH